jgi:mRNA-degrading endonuclease RelE of RelBE toxin-antitoxin system
MASMSNDPEQPQPAPIHYTPEFKRNIRQLAKKYWRIKTDVQPLLDALGQGQTPGDQIPGVQFMVFKARVRNSDSGKGKSGGYRIIYQRTADWTIILVTIYSKTEQEDIAPQDIQQIILDYEAQMQATDEAAEDVIAPDSAAGDVTSAPESIPKASCAP